MRHWPSKTKDRSRLGRALNEARRLQMLRAPAPEYPPRWPADAWERQVVLRFRSLDGTVREHVIDCYPRGRAQYAAVCDGQAWRVLGWHRIMRAAAKRFPRVGALELRCHGDAQGVQGGCHGDA